ncbi:MAG: IS4 family transposase [Caldilineaceae bacterium]|nr:IS4 family transposase [Caldilineaceae bacterium]
MATDTGIDNPNENERVTARDMVAMLPKGALILADLGYFSFAWFDHLTDQGYWWLSRLRQKTSYKVIHTYYKDNNTFDGVIWLGKYNADKASHAVRLVQFQVGTQTYRYITNVLDPQLLPMADIAKIYARRWDIEIAFKLIKRYLNLHLLWSCKTTVILQQVWAVLIISQILQSLRMEIAGRAEVDPFDVSMQLLIQYLPKLAAKGEDPIETFIKYGRQARFIRPSSRLRTEAPAIPPDLFIPLPPDLILIRKPRYAGKT